MRNDSPRSDTPSSTHPQPVNWIPDEADGSVFSDTRLGRRFVTLLEMISQRIGDSIPAACPDWAQTKAAYRFLSNQRVSESEILVGHFKATGARVEGCPGRLLILHNTGGFSYT